MPRMPTAPAAELAHAPVLRKVVDRAQNEEKMGRGEIVLPCFTDLIKGFAFADEVCELFDEQQHLRPRAQRVENMDPCLRVGLEIEVARGYG